jgi:flagellar biosynthesis/type III secretory pathway protein FliH
MAADVVTRDEFLHLEARVGVVEQEVEGEKMVTRHILEQSRRNGEDLAEFKKRTDQRFDSLERRFDNLERRFDNLERQLPTIVGDVMRDVLQERDKKR